MRLVLVRPEPGGKTKKQRGNLGRHPVACSPKAARRATGNGRAPEAGEESRREVMISMLSGTIELPCSVLKAPCLKAGCERALRSRSCR